MSEHSTESLLRDLTQELTPVQPVASLRKMIVALLGLFFSALNLLLRDTYHLIGVLITVWMFATPIFYPAGLVAVTDYAWVLDVNPMYWLIDSYRSVILYAEWPSWALLARFGLAAVASLAVGSTFFMSQKDRFPDLL